MGASEEEAGGLQPTPARQVPDYMMLQFWGLYGRREGERREQQRPARDRPPSPGGSPARALQSGAQTGAAGQEWTASNLGRQGEVPTPPGCGGEGSAPHRATPS